MEQLSDPEGLSCYGDVETERKAGTERWLLTVGTLGCRAWAGECQQGRLREEYRHNERKLEMSK